MSKEMRRLLTFLVAKGLLNRMEVEKALGIILYSHEIKAMEKELFSTPSGR